jgi:hypothetical protein
MKAIETNYNGYKFRSRLEAKWALFFDLSHIKYIYEPEGFIVDGKPYLPDFYLPETYLRSISKGVYVEIKPEKGLFVHDKFTRNLVVFEDEPMYNLFDFSETPDYNLAHKREFRNSGYQIYPFWDDCMKIFVCKTCRTSKIEFYESNYNNCPECSDDNDDIFIIDNSYDAREYRFKS